MLLLTESELVESLRNAVRCHVYTPSSSPPTSVRLIVFQGRRRRVSIDIQLSATCAPGDSSHLVPDWVFTPMQAAIVNALMEASRRGEHTLAAQEILKAAGSESSHHQLSNYFRDRATGCMHPAWGRLIQKCGRNRYRLNLPQADAVAGKAGD